jgi:hypothetical protein
MHALFAATFPDRTSGLVWNYPRARLAWAPDYPRGQGREAFEAALAQAASWGTTDYARELALSRAAQRAGIPDDERHTLTVDEELMRGYARVTRNTVSPDVAEALTQILWQTDVRDILPSVHAPTALVIGEGDATTEVEEAQHVASLMPNSKVHVLSGRSGLQRETVMEIIRGLAGIERQRAVSTVLATVLFTDIVNSTRKQAELGDRRWRELLLAHNSLVRDALSLWAAPSTTRPATASSPASRDLRAPSTAPTTSPSVSLTSARDACRSAHRRVRDHRHEARRPGGHYWGTSRRRRRPPRGRRLADRQ